MQGLAARYQVPVVVATQIGRTGEGTDPPGVATIGLSDAIAQDADVVVTMAKQTEHVIKYKLVKHRNGNDTAQWVVHFDPSQGIMREVTTGQGEKIAENDMDED
jgi:replicative DNA helicase